MKNKAAEPVKQQVSVQSCSNEGFKVSETEIARTLSEIRERVRVQLRSQGQAREAQSQVSGSATPNPTIELLRANLLVIERTRNKLPPVTSYRHGWIARFELSIKRFFKRITHWFTWEQVNFNAATANALQEVLATLSSHEEILAEIRGQLETLSASHEGSSLELTERAPYRSNHFENGLTRAAHDEPLAQASSKIDAEITQLAARLEELRAAKLRID